MTPVTLTLSSRIPFGKYKSRLVSDILKLDPKYLKWLWVEKKAIAPDKALEQRLSLTPSDFAVAGMKLPKAKLKETMNKKQLREAVRQIIRKELNENNMSVPKNQKYIIEDTNDDEILFEGTKTEVMEWMWKAFSNGFSGIEINPADDINENQPSPSKPERETTTIPAKPGTKEKPDEKRRRIGNPDVKPAPKNLKEEEMIDKITARFVKAKKTK